MPINRGYKSDTVYAVLSCGRPEESASHRSIAVYSKEEYDDFRRKGWKPHKEFCEMARRATVDRKGYWD